MSCPVIRFAQAKGDQWTGGFLQHSILRQQICPFVSLHQRKADINATE
jgi:hypothetical protein